MPMGEVYARHYAVGGLSSGLRGRLRCPWRRSTSATALWAHLLTLFRPIHDGGPRRPGGCLKTRPPLRPGHPGFLEGRPVRRPVDQQDHRRFLERSPTARFTVPRASLSFPKGERISYRTLDVEEIGPPFSGAMGFEPAKPPRRQ